MARAFDSGSNEYLENTIRGPISGPPCTIDCWFYSYNATDFWTMVQIQDKDQPTSYYVMQAAGAVGGDPVRAAQSNASYGGSGAIADTTTGFSALTWYHACGVYTVDRADAYIMGGSKGTDVTVNSAGTNIDSMSIGRRGDSTPGSYGNGLVAEVVVRNVALAPSEVAVLPYVPPWKVRLGNIVGHWPLRRRWGDRDISGRGLHMTPFNTPTWAPHPQQAQKYWFDWEMRKHRRWPTKNKPIYPAEIVWGHDTGVAESTVRNFQFNWAGTGGLQQAGQVDVESIELSAGEYMISEIVDTGNVDIEILYNVYIAGDVIDLDYRHGADVDACEAAAWNNYVGAFTSLGYAQVRVTSTL